MTSHAGSRVDPAVDLMLVEIVPPVGQASFRRVFILVARLQFFLVRVAVGAKGLFMTDGAGLTLLLRIEPVPRREVARMV
jgi:hypothetical protein